MLPYLQVRNVQPERLMLIRCDELGASVFLLDVRICSEYAPGRKQWRLMQAMCLRVRDEEHTCNRLLTRADAVFQESDRHTYDIRLTASITPRDCEEETVVTRTNLKHLCVPPLLLFAAVDVPLTALQSRLQSRRWLDINRDVFLSRGNYMRAERRKCHQPDPHDRTI